MIPGVRQFLSAVLGAVSVWVIIGLVVWSFLLVPYGVSAYQCKSPTPDITWFDCLKSVAHDLRRDSNLATYATATVAAAIALQLSTRNREANGDTD